VVAGSRKKKSKTGSGWSWRLAGIALCAFFALGVITGLSQSGRLLARRIEALLQSLPHTSRSQLIPTAYHAFFSKESTATDFGRSGVKSILTQRSEAVALAEHPDGFYQIDSEGSLLGPLSPSDTPDLPILSGSEVEHSSAAQLLDYAGELIRAETVLAAIISEMRVTANGKIRLYLDRHQLVIVLAPARFPLQLARAARVLDVWRRQRGLVAVIDMTIAGEAIVSLKADAARLPDRAAAIGVRRDNLY
jgi:Cell division protein FtsQ